MPVTAGLGCRFHAPAVRRPGRRVGVPPEHLGDADQEDHAGRPDDQKGRAPAPARDQGADHQGQGELPGAGPDLDDARHHAPVRGKPSGNGGQGDHIDGTHAHAENDAVEHVQLPDFRQPGHEHVPKTEKDRRDGHEDPRPVPVVEPPHEYGAQPHDQKRHGRRAGNDGAGPAERFHQRD